MARNIVATIQGFVLEILKSKGPQLRTSLVEQTLKKFPEFNTNTIHGAIAGLTKNKKIVQKEWGTWELPGKTKIVEEDFSSELEEPKPEVAEPRFYQPFAEWLVNEVGECNHVAALGGNVLGGKWGTPDVIGFYKEEDNSRYKRDQIISVVSAEIKTDRNAPVTAFGQACSYLLFSHKVFLVLPQNTSDRDKQKMKALCGIVGLGLVFFNSDDEKNPAFSIQLQPISREPDSKSLNRILCNNEIYSMIKKI